MKPHKHAELIKAWADGAEIQVKVTGGQWVTQDCPCWNTHYEYRIKPEPKPDITHHYFADYNSLTYEPKVTKQNLKLTFDGETGELKSAEVLK